MIIASPRMAWWWLIRAAGEGRRRLVRARRRPRAAEAALRHSAAAVQSPARHDMDDRVPGRRRRSGVVTERKLTQLPTPWWTRIRAPNPWRCLHSAAWNRVRAEATGSSRKGPFSIGSNTQGQTASTDVGRDLELDVAPQLDIIGIRDILHVLIALVCQAKAPTGRVDVSTIIRTAYVGARCGTPLGRYTAVTSQLACGGFAPRKAMAADPAARRARSSDGV